jgi:dienelactone hydrolase
MTIKDDESIDLSTQAGPMRTYVLRPVAEGRYPGIVLFSEIFQVTGPIRRTAALLAGHGFVVTVPEIFHELDNRARCCPMIRLERIAAMSIRSPRNCRVTMPMHAAVG